MGGSRWREPVLAQPLELGSCSAHAIDDPNTNCWCRRALAWSSCLWRMHLNAVQLACFTSGGYAARSEQEIVAARAERIGMAFAFTREVAGPLFRLGSWSAPVAGDATTYLTPPRPSAVKSYARAM